MATDTVRKRVVLFGGGGRLGTHGDTWEWDGSTWVFKSNTGPSPRFDSKAAFDAVRKNVVLFGGYTGLSTGSPLGDTWTWDGASWNLEFPATAPSARRNHAMAFDPVRGRVLLFGGSSGTGLMGDTWEWDGSSWTKLTPATSPGVREHAALVWHPGKRRMLLHGGQSLQTLTRFRDTWEWDGSDWRLIATGSAPDYNHDADGLVWDATDQRVLAYSGFRTWVFADPAPGVETYGNSCGPPVVPELWGMGMPYAGNAGFAMNIWHARPGVAVALLASDRRADIAIGNGCKLLVHPGLLILMGASATSADGTAVVPIPIPAARGLLGLTLQTQAWVADTIGPFLGLSLTNGVQVRVGDG